jgi:hypothetical protein
MRDVMKEETFMVCLRVDRMLRGVAIVLPSVVDDTRDDSGASKSSCGSSSSWMFSNDGARKEVLLDAIDTRSTFVSIINSKQIPY